MQLIAILKIICAKSFFFFFQKLLPEGYEHVVCTYDDTGEGQFKAQIKLRITSEIEVHKWLEDFQTSSLLTWRKSKTYPHTGCHNAYRVSLPFFGQDSPGISVHNVPSVQPVCLNVHQFQVCLCLRWTWDVSTAPIPKQLTKQKRTRTHRVMPPCTWSWNGKYTAETGRRGNTCNIHKGSV